MIDHKQTDNLTDEEIVKLTLTNQDYFLFIVSRYKNKLARFIHRLSNIGPEDADDLLQKIFLKTYLNLNSFNPKLKFSSWIYAIARNQVISSHRHRQARAEGYAVDLEDDSINKIVSDIDLEKDIDQTLTREVIEQILNTLSPKYREVLVLKFLEEKNYQEISDIIKKPIGTVGSLINRAKADFKKELAKQKVKL